MVSIDLDSKVSQLCSIELPQNIDYGIGMCPIPGNKFFCYGNWSWGFKDLTFIIDELYNFQILPPGKPNNNLNVVYFNNKIYAIGGAKNASEKFSLKKVKWKSLRQLPNGDYASSTSIVFGDTILITAICCKYILNYHIKRNEYEILSEPALNDGTNKKLFSFEGKAFIVEASGKLYESLKGDILNWNFIGTNTIQKTYFASFEVHSNNSIYFINRWAKLILFDKKSKEFKEEKFT